MASPMFPILGGILIGSAAILMMFLLGRIAGVSGIAWGAISDARLATAWRWAFLVGIVLGTFGYHQVSAQPYPAPNNDFLLASIAGLLVGFGVKLGSGCTSGHGVCGVSRLSKRSIAATGIFMVVAILTVAISNRMWGI